MFIVYLTTAFTTGIILTLLLAYKLTVIIPVDEEMWGEQEMEMSDLTIDDLIN